MNKLVSVVIPTYSRPTFICRSIESVLSQTYTPIEIIVVDDNGIGNPFQIETEQMLQQYINSSKIKYIKHNENKNGAAARNTGLKNSQGEFITFLDDDDELLPTKIEKQVNAIENSSNLKVRGAYCGCKIVKNGEIISIKKASLNGNFGKAILLGKWGLGSGSNLLLKRDAVEEIKGYDESFKRHQDTEFAIRYFRNNDVVAVSDILFIKHNDSKPKRPKSRDYIKIEEHFLNAFKDDISKMTKSESNMVYYNSYMRLAIGAANEPDIPFCIQMIKKSCEYRFITIKDFMRIIYNFIIQPQKR